LYCTWSGAITRARAKSSSSSISLSLKSSHCWSVASGCWIWATNSTSKMVHHYVVLLFLLCTSISSHQHEHDPSIISTMEQFSGYSILEPTSISSLSVDAEGLQNQVLNHSQKVLFFFSFFFWFVMVNFLYFELYFVLRLMNYQDFLMHLLHQ
jgi:hypothetical protein